MTLTDFLLARIAEDEAMARDALHADAVTPGSWMTEHHNSEYHAEPDCCHIAEDRHGHYWTVASEVYIPIAEHIARHDPARVLAECGAKRDIIEMACNIDDSDDEYAVSLRDGVLATLALPYVDHPDYDEAWRPVP